MKKAKILIYILLVMISFSCQKEKKDKFEKSEIKKEKIKFSDFINTRRILDIKDISINNLDSLSGFRNLILGQSLDSLSEKVDFSKLKTIEKDEIIIKSGYNLVKFGESEYLIFTRLSFFKLKLVKIELKYSCEVSNGCRQLGYTFKENFKTFLGKSSYSKTFDCETLTEKQARSQANFFGSKELNYKNNCNYLDFWSTNSIKLSLIIKNSSENQKKYESNITYELKKFNDSFENINNILKIDSLKIIKERNLLQKQKEFEKKQKEINNSVKDL